MSFVTRAPSAVDIRLSLPFFIVYVIIHLVVPDRHYRITGAWDRITLL
jgi:hypothetical protein